MDLRWWRSQIGLVQQEPFLFNGTIQGNIEHGLIGTQWENEPPEVKLELVQKACREAFADEFIARLPDASLSLPSFSFDSLTPTPLNLPTAIKPDASR
jgi:ABC-type multidrug transport system fused ATPase/permease subunit